MSDDIRVMVVEDDFMVAEINKQVTEQVDGFKVVKTALNGSAALNQLAHDQIDLVVLDVYLPDLNGLDVLKEARRCEYPVDFILITAAHDTHTVEQAMRYGIVDYLIKPFDFARYKAALAEYRDKRFSLKSVGAMNQGFLDSLLVRSTALQEEMSLPKGISPLTLQKIKDYLKETHKEALASEIAERMSISRVTARRYLEHLASTGVLRKEIRYQKIGRPLIFYVKI
jgi:two-component system response regulator DctR